MEYFKVKDKAIGGETYYIAFTSNNMAVNMTGKADIAKTIWHCNANNEPYYTVEIETNSPFDLNIVDIEYELEPEDWSWIIDMSSSETKLTDNFHNYDPLVDKSVSMYGYLFPVGFLKRKIDEVMNPDEGLVMCEEENEETNI